MRHLWRKGVHRPMRSLGDKAFIALWAGRGTSRSPRSHQRCTLGAPEVTGWKPAYTPDMWESGTTTALLLRRRVHTHFREQAVLLYECVVGSGMVSSFSTRLLILDKEVKNSNAHVRAIAVLFKQNYFADSRSASSAHLSTSCSSCCSSSASF